ncbi:MAG: hypothetical protein AB7E31_14640 [Desulfitobacterium sp.]
MNEIEMPANEAIRCPVCGKDLLPCSTCEDEKENRKPCDWSKEAWCWRFPKEKGPQELALLMDPTENVSTESISQIRAFRPYNAVNSFSGKAKDLQALSRARMIFIKAGVIS